MYKNDFDFFWKTHLVTTSQGCHIPEETVLYWHTAKEEASSFPWTRREGSSRSHATAAAARDLLTQVRVSTRKNILTATLIQNYSPCSLCAEEFLKVINLAEEKRIKLDISITFVALNGIRRPSWIWRGMDNSIHKVTVNESNDNISALRRLQDVGVRLSTFNPDTWKFLFTFLGLGMPVESHGKFLGGKYLNVESRLDEDRFMETDFKQILKGLTITKANVSSSNTTLSLAWSPPDLAVGKVSEYKVVCRKVTVKNREDDDRSWRIQQIVDSIGVTVVIPGELTSFQLLDLEFDAFYDITVESFVKGLSTNTGRKLFRTGNRVPVPSLQTPTMARKLIISARPRTSSAASFSSVTPLLPEVRVKRSNSIQGPVRGTYSTSGQESGTIYPIDKMSHSIATLNGDSAHGETSRYKGRYFFTGSF
uniref:Uncharacterized protein n=1 Tax=Arion vulgaris TaxID=1028688 RepID=A0A0B6Z3U6_9EUPU